MSLINDALKRTQEAQQNNPPPAGGPPLKPVEAADARSAARVKSFLFIMVACVIVGNVLLFIALRDSKPAGPPSAPAQEARQSDSPPQNPAAVAPGPAPSHPAPESGAASVTNAGPAPVPAPEPTNAAAVAPAPAVEAPKPAPLKLQSIIYNPSRPSAMISGKFLFLGDRIQGFRLVAIDAGTVTLVGNGQTNVLSLP